MKVSEDRQACRKGLIPYHWRRLPVPRFQALSYVLVLFGALLGAGGCSRSGPASSTAPPPEGKGFQLVSAAFKDGDPVPSRYINDGDDRSPPLTWYNAPKGTRAFALICFDPDAPGKGFTHWVLYDIPGTTSSLPEGISRDEAETKYGIQGSNDFGRLGYIGPSPPAGSRHAYHFTLYALDTPTGLKSGATRGDVDAAMAGHILAQAVLKGTCLRPKP